MLDAPETKWQRLASSRDLETLFASEEYRAELARCRRALEDPSADASPIYTTALRNRIAALEWVATLAKRQARIEQQKGDRRREEDEDDAERFRHGMRVAG